MIVRWAWLLASPWFGVRQLAAAFTSWQEPNHTARVESGMSAPGASSRQEERQQAAALHI